MPLSVMVDRCENINITKTSELEVIADSTVVEIQYYSVTYAEHIEKL